MLEHFASPWNVIYAAKDLAGNPAGPAPKSMAPGPSSSSSTSRAATSPARNENYFKKGLPYLDGFKGIFTLQAAAMLNAVQGGQVLGEFRGISPAERDRLMQAMGDKIRIEESGWTLTLLVCFDVDKKPFDDVRVRRALLMAIDRWGGSLGLAKSRRCARSAASSVPARPLQRRKRIDQTPGFSKDIKKSARKPKSY